MLLNSGKVKGVKKYAYILTEDTRYTGSASYEIEQAIDNYKIPLIIAYPGVFSTTVDALSNLCTKALADRINKFGTEAIHIASKGLYLTQSHSFMSMENTYNGKNYYCRDAYIQWGLIK